MPFNYGDSLSLSFKNEQTKKFKLDGRDRRDEVRPKLTETLLLAWKIRLASQNLPWQSLDP